MLELRQGLGSWPIGRYLWVIESRKMYKCSGLWFLGMEKMHKESHLLAIAVAQQPDWRGNLPKTKSPYSAPSPHKEVGFIRNKVRRRVFPSLIDTESTMPASNYILVENLSSPHHQSLSRAITYILATELDLSTYTQILGESTVS